MTKPVLYSYFRSSASWRVRIALAIKGVEYDQKPVHLVKDGGQQKTEEYSSLNPMKQVPTLLIDGQTLTQSLPIIEYLDETRPGTNIIPADPLTRFKARQVAEVINSGIQPVQNLSVLTMVGEWCNNPDKKAEWGHYYIEKGFHAVEKLLAAYAGVYSVGDSVTIADLCLIPQIYNANRFKVDMSQFPTITRVGEALVKLDVFKAADPANQPDCPEEMRQ